MKLVIVESPTKIRSFKKILGKDKEFEFFATLGHIRDLPKKKFGVKIDEDFKPFYVIVPARKKVVAQLKKLGQQADEIILATDPDREGESIAYHIAYLLGFIKEQWPDFEITNSKSLKRIIFYEITPTALKSAFENAGDIRKDLVKAQFTRRILDRIVGYKVSPLLWKKIGKNWLSAGRVQTVALRLIVEREKERREFKKEQYYQVLGLFEKDNEKVQAVLRKVKGEDVEEKRTLELFAGKYTYSFTKIKQENVDKLVERLQDEKFYVKAVEENIVKRIPPPPLTTSLLQQEASRTYRYSAKFTMSIAQNLYERGLITYHRTDSFNLSNSFVFQARKIIEKILGKEYLAEKPRKYKTKSKMAQEAHEAIRPTNPSLTPENLKGEGLTVAHKRIYSLIYTRALMSQMREAEIKIMRIEIETQSKDLFIARLENVVFPGFLIMVEKNKKNKSFVSFKQGDELVLIDLKKLLKETTPPSRYTEATLIKVLEEKGIGRPSTYAPIVSLIQEKKYVEKSQGYFVPTLLGEKISDYLSKVFPDLFNLEFTAKMEDTLDKVANGEKDPVKVLSEFYTSFEKDLNKGREEEGFINIEEKTDEKCPKCGKNLVIRFSRFGKFLACSGYPECKFVKEFKEYVEGYKCPKCGGRLVVRRSKKGKRFYGCENYPKCDYAVWKLSKK